MGILQREYGISRKEALWEYSYQELQQLVTELPLERIVQVGPNDKKSDIERKWLEATADFDSERIVKDKDLFDLKVKKIELRAKIKKETSPEVKKRLEEQLEKLG